MPAWAPVVIAAVALVVIVAALFKLMWKVPRANEALIVTGFGIGKAQSDAARSYKVVTGSGAFVLPGLQKAQYLSLAPTQVLLQVHGFDTQRIPIGIRGSVVFKVGNGEQEITNAAIRFLDDQDVSRGENRSQMDQMVTEVVHGHLRSMIGSLTVEQIIGDRSALAQAAREASVTEIEAMGLVIDSLQVQEVEDPSGYISALGEARTAEVKAQARIAQANRDREASEAEQQARALVAAAQAESEQRQAEAQAQIEKARAISAQAGPLADAEARQAVVQKETEIATLEKEREQARLEATVYRQADAQAYEERTRAEASRDAAIAAAEAKAREVELAGSSQANAAKVLGEAEADATRARGLAEAASVEAKGLAEAKGIEARAIALEKESEAVIGQTLAESMPEIVKQAASAFANVDQMTVLNGAEGVTQALTQIVSQVGPLVGAARQSMAQASAKPKEGNGHVPERVEETVTRVVTTQ